MNDFCSAHVDEELSSYGVGQLTVMNYSHPPLQVTLALRVNPESWELGERDSVRRLTLGLTHGPLKLGPSPEKKRKLAELSQLLFYDSTTQRW